MSFATQPSYAQAVHAFDALAHAHDSMRWAPAEGSFDAAVDKELTQLAGADPGRVVALGGGSGAELRPFVARGWRCTLVDGSAEMLDLARLRHPTGVCIRAGDATAYLGEKPAGSFEVILQVGELIGYVSDPAALLRATARTLTSDGLLVQTFADASRMRQSGACVLAEDETGFTFYEREDPPLVMAAFDLSPLLALHRASGLTLLSTIAGPGPRTCLIAVRTHSDQEGQS